MAKIWQCNLPLLTFTAIHTNVHALTVLLKYFYVRIIRLSGNDHYAYAGGVLDYNYYWHDTGEGFF